MFQRHSIRTRIKTLVAIVGIQNLTEFQRHSIRTRIKTLMIKKNNDKKKFQRHSIRTRIKTENQLVKDHISPCSNAIPLEQGLRQFKD